MPCAMQGHQTLLLSLALPLEEGFFCCGVRYKVETTFVEAASAREQRAPSLAAEDTKADPSLRH